MAINANNYIELAHTSDSFYVLSNGNGMYFVRDFDKPSLEHPMFCSNNVREATRYDSLDKANEAHAAIMSWHCSGSEDVNRLAQKFLADCKPQQVFHTERFEIPKDVMIRNAKMGSRQVVADFVDILGG